MTNAIVGRSLVNESGSPAATRSTTRSVASRWHLGMVPLAAAALLAVAVVLCYQVRLRAPLTWDEASRVDGGALLDGALSSDTLGPLRDWFTTLDQPVVAPTLHGLALVVVDDPTVAAWLPSTVAFVVAGLLSALLARRLGAGTVGAWGAAVLVWTTPIGAKLAAGAFTENLGACLLIGAVVVLGRLRRAPSTPVAVAAGSLVALAWWTSHDYGLTAAAVVVVSALARARAGSQGRLHLLSGTVAVALVAAHALATGSARHTGNALRGLIARDRSLAEIDLLYYPRALFDSETFAHAELGVSPVVAAALVLGAIWAVVSFRRRPEWRLPVLAVAVWVAVYAPATVKGARFVALVVPVLASLTAAGARELIASSKAALRGRGRAVGATATGVMLVAGLLVIPVQAADQLSELRRQLWFVQPNETADRSLAFIADHLPPAGSRPLLMIGATSALSPRLVQLVWDRRLDRRSSGVHLVPEADRPSRRRQLAETLDVLRPGIVVAVRTGSSSRLAPERTATGEELFPSQRDYARLAVELADRGELVPVAAMTLEDDPVRIGIWRTVVPPDDEAHDGG